MDLAQDGSELAERALAHMDAQLRSSEERLILENRGWWPYTYDVQERIAAYNASIARLSQNNRELRAEQKRLWWIVIMTVVLSLGAYVWRGGYTGLFVLIVGGSAFFVGQYVVYMHIQENRLTIKSARQSIASLESASH